MPGSVTYSTVSATLETKFFRGIFIFLKGKLPGLELVQLHGNMDHKYGSITPAIDCRARLNHAAKRERELTHLCTEIIKKHFYIAYLQDFYISWKNTILDIPFCLRYFIEDILFTNRK
ncbi:hypothetical protein ACJX0J_022786 [Zea mays]